jgi:AbrB family looped-hinge helix DNA binding protein
VLLRLSSKGQVVLPKPIRDLLRLKNGDQFHAHVVDGKIILEPIQGDVIERLHGKFAGSDLLKELEEEHRREVENAEDCRP